jgi:hypothetical protein
MDLKGESKIGLTFGQVISVLTIIAAIFMAYQSMSVRLVAAEIRITKLEQNQLENRDDHQKILDKLDKILFQSNK